MKKRTKAIVTLALIALLTLSAAIPALAATYITKAKAKSIALEHAGLTAAQVTFTEAKREYEDGRRVYEIEFYKDGQEYDYEIDAATGKVISFDYDMESARPARAQSTAGVKLTEAQAKEKALAHAGLKEDEVVFLKAWLERDDGRMVYELEFYKGNAEYDYEVDAATGKILSCDYDLENDAPRRVSATATGKSTGSASASEVTLEKAKSTALAHAGLSASQVTFTKARKEYDDGRMVYEIEFRKGRMEYEYELSASTGKILDWDKEYDD